MTRLNPNSERIKRNYRWRQKEAQNKSEATVDAILKALSRFEDAMGGKDFVNVDQGANRYGRLTRGGGLVSVEAQWAKTGQGLTRRFFVRPMSFSEFWTGFDPPGSKSSLSDHQETI